MNGFQRIQAILEGNDVDITPIGGWQHNSLIDRDPEKMIAGTIKFTEENNWDLVKIMSQPQYMGESIILLLYNTDKEINIASYDTYIQNGNQNKKI